MLAWGLLREYLRGYCTVLIPISYPVYREKLPRGVAIITATKYEERERSFEQNLKKIRTKTP